MTTMTVDEMREHPRWMEAHRHFARYWHGAFHARENPFLYQLADLMGGLDFSAYVAPPSPGNIRTAWRTYIDEKRDGFKRDAVLIPDRELGNLFSGYAREINALVDRTFEEEYDPSDRYHKLLTDLLVKAPVATPTQAPAN